MATVLKQPSDRAEVAWRDFAPGSWQQRVNLREFIQRNYTPEIRRARASGVVTGLPDAYGRGRIIGDYRRVALYGVDFLIADKKREKEELDERHSTEEVIRLREELSDQIRSLEELKEMASRYG